MWPKNDNQIKVTIDILDPTKSGTPFYSYTIGHDRVHSTDSPPKDAKYIEVQFCFNYEIMVVAKVDGEYFILPSVDFARLPGEMDRNALSLAAGFRGRFVMNLQLIEDARYSILACRLDDMPEWVKKDVDFKEIIDGRIIIEDYRDLERISDDDAVVLQKLLVLARRNPYFDFIKKRRNRQDLIQREQ